MSELLVSLLAWVVTWVVTWVRRRWYDKKAGGELRPDLTSSAILYRLENPELAYRIPARCRW